MYIVYSTTKSFELYPDNVLIVAGVPALAVKEPERLVVIPTSFPAFAAIVTVSVPAFVVIVTFDPAANVRVSVAESATTLL